MRNLGSATFLSEQRGEMQMIFNRKVGFVCRGDFCSVFKAGFGFCFKKNPMKQQQKNKLLYLQNEFTR